MRRSSSASSVSIRSASRGGLSQRSRLMRGNRMAMPDLCRLDRCRPSNATSNTRPLSGFVHDLAHRSEAVDGIRPHEAIDLGEFVIGEAEIGLADRHEFVAVFARGPHAEGIVRIEGRALAVAALGIHQHRIDDERIALPLPPQALWAGPADRARRAASASRPRPPRRRRPHCRDWRARRQASSQLANGSSGERSMRGSWSAATNASSRRASVAKGSVAQVARRSPPADRRRGDAAGYSAISFARSRSCGSAAAAAR